MLAGPQTRYPVIRSTHTIISKDKAMEWRAVPNFPDYEVSSEGVVRRATASSGTQSGRVLKPKITKQGYHEVVLQHRGRRKYRRVNRLVCEAWHGSSPPDRPFACHKNDVPSENTPDNLYWGTRADNAKDALTNGRYLRGEACGSSIHSEETIRNLKKDRSSTGASIDVLSLRYKISRSQVSKILNGQYWAHVL